MKSCIYTISLIVCLTAAGYAEPSAFSRNECSLVTSYIDNNKLTDIAGSDYATREFSSFAGLAFHPGPATKLGGGGGYVEYTIKSATWDKSMDGISGFLSLEHTLIDIPKYKFTCTLAGAGYITMFDYTLLNLVNGTRVKTKPLRVSGSGGVHFKTTIFNHTPYIGVEYFDSHLKLNVKTVSGAIPAQFHTSLKEKNKVGLFFGDRMQISPRLAMELSLHLIDREYIRFGIMYR